MIVLEVGGWVKLARNETIINGKIRKVTPTHIQVEGLPPIPRDYWAVIISKAAPKQEPTM